MPSQDLISLISNPNSLFQMFLASSTYPILKDLTTEEDKELLISIAKESLDYAFKVKEICSSREENYKKIILFGGDFAGEDIFKLSNEKFAEDIIDHLVKAGGEDAEIAESVLVTFIKKV